MAAINDPYLILIAYLVAGLLIIFLIPPVMKSILKLNIGLAKVEIVKKYWDFILSKKIIQIFGILWIIIAIAVFIYSGSI